MRKLQRQPAAQPFSVYDRVTAAVLALGAVLVPVTYAKSGIDTFREPKEIVFRVTAILTCVVAVFAATAARGTWRAMWQRVPREEKVLCGVILLWTLITTITSTNRLLSVSSVVTVCATIVLYLTARRLVPSWSFTALDVCLVPAVVNTIVILLQEYTSWNPFVFPDFIGGHTKSTALLGHPNDAGVYLLGPVVAAIAAVTVTRGKRRAIYGLLAFLFLSGIIASATRTALIAFAASMLVFALHRPWKQALAILAGLAIVATASFEGSSLIRRQFRDVIDAARAAQYDKLTSERLMPFLTAINMVRKRPIMGVGPGCFRYHYMDERLALTRVLPPQLTHSWPQNFGETHNDHLQIMAETGLPGYALLLAALIIILRPGFRRPPDEASEQTAFAHAFAIPLVAAFAVVALAQFPLQIAATRGMFIGFAAIATGWGSRYA